MTKDEIDSVLEWLDSSGKFTEFNNFKEAADCIRYLQADRDGWHADAQTYYKEMYKRDVAIVELQAELERERIRLAACGVVAMVDTPDSAAKVRDMHPDYYSASCGDVERRVDECINLRQKCADLQAELDKIKGSEVVGYMNEHGEVCENTGNIPLIRRPE